MPETGQLPKGPSDSLPNRPKFDSPRALLVMPYKVTKTRCLMSQRKSKFAPIRALSLEELMPDRLDFEPFLEERKVHLGLL